MVITPARSKRKITGGRYRKSRKKRMHEIGRAPTLTKLGVKKLKIIKTKGGSTKLKLLKTETANVLDKKTNKYSKAKILSIIESPANRHFVRRGILTKGTIVETEKGKAKITSRPGQEGVINAVLI